MESRFPLSKAVRSVMAQIPRRQACPAAGPFLLAQSSTVLWRPSPSQASRLAGSRAGPLGLLRVAGVSFRLVRRVRRSLSRRRAKFMGLERSCLRASRGRKPWGWKSEPVDRLGHPSVSDRTAAVPGGRHLAPVDVQGIQMMDGGAEDSRGGSRSGLSLSGVRWEGAGALESAQSGAGPVSRGAGLAGLFGAWGVGATVLSAILSRAPPASGRTLGLVWPKGRRSRHLTGKKKKELEE